MTEETTSLAVRLLLKNWTVSVLWASGATTSAEMVAVSRGKALADAWRSDAFNGSTFGEFLKFARCRRAPDPSWWGKPITVEGKPAFYLGHNRQYVSIAYPGGTFALNAHPYDVLPLECRPEGYRDRLDAGSESLTAPKVTAIRSADHG